MSDQTQTILGGWTPYHSLSADDKKVFTEATKGLIGVKYDPQTVSTQLVAGTNYRFKCIASLPQGGVIWDAVVEIYAPLQGAPYVTGIIRA